MGLGTFFGMPGVGGGSLVDSIVGSVVGTGAVDSSIAAIGAADAAGTAGAASAVGGGVTLGNLLTGAQVGSSLLGAGAALQAGGLQANAANNATALEGQMFNIGQQNVAPWLQSGQLSLAQLNNFLGQGTPIQGGNTQYGAAMQPFTNTNLANDPGYQFALGQGVNAVNNNATTFGGQNSGNTMKAINNYAQGEASNTYDTAFNQYMQQLNQIYSMLSGSSGVGANAALGTAGIGAQTGATMGNTITQAANAQAAGTVGATNTINSGVGSLSNNMLISQLLANQSAQTGSQNIMNTPAFG